MDAGNAIAAAVAVGSAVTVWVRYASKFAVLLERVKQLEQANTRRGRRIGRLETRIDKIRGRLEVDEKVRRLTAAGGVPTPIPDDDSLEEPSVKERDDTSDD